MATTVDTSRHSRLRFQLQPLFVKLYRFAGMIALLAILLGLLSFITVAVFYYLNRTWVRPVILSPEHAKVIEASTALSEARLRRSELDSESALAKAEVDSIDRLVAANGKFIDDVKPLLAGGITSAEAALARREADRAELDRAWAIDRKKVLETRIGELDQRAIEQGKLVDRLAASPYVRAAGERRVVGFVPYQNLTNVQPGVTLFGCDWGLIRCHKVGTVKSILDGEVQDVHPHDDSIQRGVMVEIQLVDAGAAEQKVIFAGSRPLFW